MSNKILLTYLLNSGVVVYILVPEAVFVLISLPVNLTNIGV